MYTKKSNKIPETWKYYLSYDTLLAPIEAISKNHMLIYLSAELPICQKKMEHYMLQIYGLLIERIQDTTPITNINEGKLSIELRCVAM